jgi:hypothetical protein
MKMIDEIKKYKKEEMFKPKVVKKVSFLNKILAVLGYGKKG